MVLISGMVILRLLALGKYAGTNRLAWFGLCTAGRARCGARFGDGAEELWGFTCTWGFMMGFEEQGCAWMAMPGEEEV